MPRIVFISGYTLMQKILYTVKHVTGLTFLALYTSLGKNMTIEKTAKDLHLAVKDINILKTPSGIEQLRDLKPDWIFNVNSMVIFTKDILAIPRLGCLNLHMGKLPEYAGLHVHQWAIRNDERIFASTVHWMEEKIDTGPIAYVQEFPVTSQDTGLSLFMKCKSAGEQIVLRALNDIASGKFPPKIAQDLSKRTLYTNKDAENGRICWKWSSRQIYNFVRAADYHPLHSPTYTPACTLSDGRTIHILKAKQSSLSSRQPGEVIAVEKEGIIVGTQDKLSICITKIKDDQNMVVEGETIAKVLGCSAGDVLVDVGDL